MGLKYLMGTQKTIICRLELTNPGFGPFFVVAIFDFLGLKKGVAPKITLSVWAPKPDQKVDPRCGPFGSPVILK